MQCVIIRHTHRHESPLKSQHEIIIDAPRAIVWDAFSGNGDIAVIDDITDHRRPDFVAGSSDSPGCRAIIVGHFSDAGKNATRIIVYANRFFSGVRKLTSVLQGRALRQEIDDQLHRLKLSIESRSA